MLSRIIAILATLAAFYNDWQRNKAAEAERKKIIKEIEDESDRVADLVADIRNDPDLNDDYILHPKDRGK